MASQMALVIKNLSASSGDLREAGSNPISCFSGIWIKKNDSLSISYLVSLELSPLASRVSVSKPSTIEVFFWRGQRTSLKNTFIKR